jgi:hypothetical protein
MYFIYVAKNDRIVVSETELKFHNTVLDSRVVTAELAGERISELRSLGAIVCLPIARRLVHEYDKTHSRVRVNRYAPITVELDKLNIAASIYGFSHYSSGVDLTKYTVEYSDEDSLLAHDLDALFWALPYRITRIGTGEEVTGAEARGVLLEMALVRIRFNASEFLASASAMISEALDFGSFTANDNYPTQPEFDVPDLDFETATLDEVIDIGVDFVDDMEFYGDDGGLHEWAPEGGTDF